MNVKSLQLVKSSPSLGFKALPEGVQQAAGEEKKEIQGHMLLRAWGVNQSYHLNYP